MKTETEIRQRILEKEVELNLAIGDWQMKKNCELRGARVDRIENEIGSLEWVLYENTKTTQSDE